jgi:hypothetical protein
MYTPEEVPRRPHFSNRSNSGCRHPFGGSELVVVERVLPERVGPEHLDLVLNDLNMMAMTCGRERTEAEFAELFAGAGFRLDRVVSTGTNVSVVEATPV